MTVGDLFSRALNLGKGPTSPLQADLRRITDAELLESPAPDVLLNVTTATNVVDDRREIMLHLQECLAESSSRRWRRVHGGLVLLEHLMKSGSPAVVSEIAEGKHFDPVQRLTFLERFEFSDDRRVQNVVRQKASALRQELVARLQDPHAKPTTQSAPSRGPGRGSNSPSTTRAGGQGAAANSSTSSGKYVGFGSDANVGAAVSSSTPPYLGFGNDSLPEFIDVQGSKPKTVNGLVAVGHKDDTESESSGDDGRSRPRAGKKDGPGGIVVAVSRRKPMEDSTDSDGSGERRRRERRREKPSTKLSGAAGTSRTAPVEADLLGGFDDGKCGDKPDATIAQTTQEDLLGGIFGESIPQPTTAPQAKVASDLLDF